ncbi:phage tail sheath family protein [Cohnella abietis]|uniref:Phage tail sheath protein n=1 Tax=Cohnella abietis TaxID=2507935 RepID=A0A3T1D1Q7_9BACL|nr:phage tail sheath family protein [Cohnella abietis]BBI32043.1 hypothetical protein KCTCHS21_14420 [Cohnella abietis]
MAGGTWVSQNKIRPGVYINFVGDGGPLGTLGERGIAAIALILPWGPSQSIMQIEAGEDVFVLLGHDIAAKDLLLVKESLKQAKTLLLYRLNIGTKATATSGTLTITAKHGGIRGNDIKVVIQANLDDNAKFDVITKLDGVTKDKQVVANVAELVANDWVVFSGTATLTASAGIPLVGGANGAVVNGDHTGFLMALELLDFQTVAYTGADSVLKGIYSAYVKRLRDDEGKKVQAVVANYPAADHEGVISVKNGVILSDGTKLTAEQATAWVAAATAAASVASSLTFQGYDDAIDANPRYTNAQIEAALVAGEFLFTANRDRAIVEQDINTLTSFTPDKTRPFAKNRIIRVLDGIGNDFKRIYESFYIGKVDNNADGRNLLKSECINYLDALQQAAAIQNFESADVIVLPGADSDSVYVELHVQPVDAIEKVYMKVKVK